MEGFRGERPDGPAFDDVDGGLVGEQQDGDSGFGRGPDLPNLVSCGGSSDDGEHSFAGGDVCCCYLTGDLVVTGACLDQSYPGVEGDDLVDEVVISTSPAGRERKR